MGEGAFGTVFPAKHKATGEMRACKKAGKRKMMVELMKEIEIMKIVDHPNIIKLYETLDAFIVFPFFGSPKGSLFHFGGPRKEMYFLPQSRNL